MIRRVTHSREEFNKTVEKYRNELNWYRCDYLGKRVNLVARNGRTIAYIVLEDK